jgi:transposase-like protein
LVDRDRYSQELRKRGVRIVAERENQHESQWETIASVAEKIGCSAATLRKWVRQAERDAGTREGVTSEKRERLEALEKENRDVKRTNAILREASAYFAQASR